MMGLPISILKSTCQTRALSPARFRRRRKALTSVESNGERLLVVAVLLLAVFSARCYAFHAGSPSTLPNSCVRAKMPTQNSLVPHIRYHNLHTLQSSKDDFDETSRNFPPPKTDTGGSVSPSDNEDTSKSAFSLLSQFFQQGGSGLTKMPPIRVEDINVLLYDVFLIVNLSLSISFWVTHRLSFEYLASAFSEGSLLSILWIASGLYHGAFLMSAVDGHYGSTDERGGPKAAAALGLTTFINAINLRLVLALLVSIIQHREVGLDPGEQLIPLEIAFGIVLMSSWRALHSWFTPRM